MPTRRYVEEISLAARLATKRSAGVAPKVNLREHVTCTRLPSTNKSEVQKQGYQSRHKKHLCPPKIKNKFL